MTWREGQRFTGSTARGIQGLRVFRRRRIIRWSCATSKCTYARRRSACPCVGASPGVTRRQTEASGDRSNVRLDLSPDEALVLSDWLARTSGHSSPAPFVDPSEQQVLWNLECMLERDLVEPFSAAYTSALESARRSIRGPGVPGDCK